MSLGTVEPARAILVAYDRRAVYGLLRDRTPGQLREELAAGAFGAGLAPDERAELEGHLTAWVQRALGALSLRDALLVDRRRGQRVFALICASVTRAGVVLPESVAQQLQAVPSALGAVAAPPAVAAELASLERLARDEQLELLLLPERLAYRLPDDLAALVPAPPPPYRGAPPPFEQPTGWRRRIAALLATGGVALLGLPMLLGHIPDHPAGLPLALLTVALLIGIRAGPAGFAGSVCIWLVANLPGFRHGSAALAILWPALPLMALGIGLLSFDRRVRAMWGWLRSNVERRA